MATRLYRLRRAMALAIDDHPVIIDTDDIRAALAVCEAAVEVLEEHGDPATGETTCQCLLCRTVRALLAEAPDERPASPDPAESYWCPRCGGRVDTAPPSVRLDGRTHCQACRLGATMQPGGVVVWDRAPDERPDAAALPTEAETARIVVALRQCEADLLAAQPPDAGEGWERCDILATNTRTDGHRVWWSGGAWLHPGQSIAVIEAPDERPAYPLLDCSQRCAACRHVDGARTTPQWAECALHNRSMPPNSYCEDFAPAREPADPPAHPPDVGEGWEPCARADAEQYRWRCERWTTWSGWMVAPDAEDPAVVYQYRRRTRTCATCRDVGNDRPLGPPVYIEVAAEVRYWEDARVNDAADTDGNLIPFRRGDLWCPVIRLADGQVMDWPDGLAAEVHYKVCDAGQYWLLDANRRRVGKWSGYYVPDAFLCQGDTGYGDYIILEIGTDGKVRDWAAPTVLPEEWPATAGEGGAA